MSSSLPLRAPQVRELFPLLPTYDGDTDITVRLTAKELTLVRRFCATFDTTIPEFMRELTVRMASRHQCVGKVLP